MRQTSLLAVGLWAASPAWAECPVVADEIERAMESLEVLDLQSVEAHLASAEAGLGCGPAAAPALLARLWLVDGTWRTFDNKMDEAQESFAAAHRADPSAFLDAFADTIRGPYDAAAAAEPQASTLTVRPALGEGWVVLVDGVPMEMPAEVTAGLHAVQVLPAQDQDALFAAVVLSPPGLQSSVDHGLPAEPPTSEPVAPAPAPAPAPGPAPAPDPTPVSEPVGSATVEAPSSGARVALHAALGADVAFGEPLTVVRTDGVREEPAVKPSVPIELGLGLSAGSFWFRGHISAAPLIGGDFLWSDDGTDHYTKASFGGGVTLGANFGSMRAGALVAAVIPGRIASRLVFGLDFGDLPIGAELRGGLNVVTERRSEPAFALLITVRLGGF